MSGTTFTTFPVQSHPPAQAASKAGSNHGSAVEQSYAAASQSITAPTAPTTGAQAPGPGVTTLAIGEEDGGGAAVAAPEIGAMSTPSSSSSSDGGYQVTTLAIGEEDGGVSTSNDQHTVIGGPASGGYGAMQPIYSPGEPQYSRFAKTSETTDILNFSPIAHGSVSGASAPSATGHMPESASPQDYGTMQPIYSPGEPEYAAYAKTTETADLLNFHPVTRVPKTAIPQTPPPMAPPVNVPAPATEQPIVMASTSVGALPESVPQSGSFESVGSYEDYVRSLTATPAAPAPAASEQSVTAQPIYEPHESPALSSDYDSLASTGTSTPAVEGIPAAPVAPPTPVYDSIATPAAEYAAPANSVEPQPKPEPFEKDTPFDYTGGVEPADPADGNPDYVAPAQASAPKAEPSYVEVPIDNYWAETTSKAVESPAKPAPATTPAPATPEIPQPPAPASVDTAPAKDAQGTTSLGGSYVVIDTAIPQSLTGAASGTGKGGLNAPSVASPDASGDGMDIVTGTPGEKTEKP